MTLYENLLLTKLFIVILINPIVSFPKSLVWTGGPLHVDCDHTADLWTPSGPYVKENVIAVKALTHSDKIFIVTPRIKHGVLATVWQIVQDNGCVELTPYPSMRAHKLADCAAVQNAVDVHIDHLGQLWVLDSGIVDTNDEPQCMCPPKIVVISVLLKTVTKSIDLSSLTKPSTQVQNIAVEYGIGGKPFIYVSDASRGAILVYDVLEESGWVVVVCAPTAGLQFALVRRALGHSVMLLVRLQYAGIIELDTSILKRKMSPSTVTVLGSDTKPVSLLGYDANHLYFRHIECADVLSWDARQPFDSAHHKHEHSAGPCLTPTSVTADPLKPFLVVLESDYGDTVLSNLPTYHRINFISTI